MTQIVIGTTPTITYKFKIVSPSDFRASAVKTDIRDIDAIEWGTIEQGVIERKRYSKPITEEVEE